MSCSPFDGAPVGPRQNTVLHDAERNSSRGDVAERIARQTLAKRGPDYTNEVRRLLDAALEVDAPLRHHVSAPGRRHRGCRRACPTTPSTATSHPRTCWWRPSSKTAPNAWPSYLAHQMAKQARPEDKVRVWVEGILSQAADAEIASTTLAVLWNAGSLGEGSASGPPSASAPLAALVVAPFEALGSTEPDLAASLAAHAVVGKLSDYLWQRTRPTSADTRHIVACCLALASHPPSPLANGRSHR